MNLSLIALLFSLALPELREVKRCEDLLPLRWETSLYEVDANRPQSRLFIQEEFADASQWVATEGDTTGTGLVTRCFGTPTPHSKQVIVHHYPPAPLTAPRTRPVLLITGAGDQALRSMSFLAVHLSRRGFDSYAVTFAHRQGDNFLQAQQIANVIEVMKEKHRVDKVDVVAYSKGGVSTRIYSSNTADADWSGTHDLYQELGTRYRGDIGRLFFMGTPHRGLDTAFRWPNSNFFAIMSEIPPDSPTSWTAYYPTGVAFLLNKTDLSDRCLYPEVSSAYVGQAQLLAKLDEVVALPGGNLSLGGVYASQTDYFTTYYGGIGFYTESLGIQAAIDQSGDLMGKLISQEGVAPDIQLYVGAGGNPIMSVGGIYAQAFDYFWGDLDAAERRRQWESFAGSWIAQSSPWYSEAFSFDLPRLYAGTAFLGEISGASDGLLLLDSATYLDGLKLRGANVVEQRIFHALNHAELIAAGQLASDFYGDEELAGVFYDPNLSQKYAQAENQAIEWIAGHLVEPVVNGYQGNGDPSDPNNPNGDPSDPNNPNGDPSDPNNPNGDPSDPNNLNADQGRINPSSDMGIGANAGADMGNQGALDELSGMNGSVVGAANGNGSGNGTMNVSPINTPQVQNSGRFAGSCEQSGSSVGGFWLLMILMMVIRKRKQSMQWQ